MSDTAGIQTGEKSPFISEIYFNEQWHLYQKILEKNYMGHQEIYATLKKCMVNNFSKPFTMLELGCGDACFTSNILLNTQITNYMGVDLSETALKNAQVNMKPINCDKHFIQDNILQKINQLLKNQQTNFDVILASFVLHHLSLEEKESVFAQIQQLLKPNGKFILIDIFRQQQENRENYLQRYLNHIQKDWVELSSPEFAMVKGHISESDFPETQQTIYKLADKCQFSGVECLYNDTFDTTNILCFST